MVSRTSNYPSSLDKFDSSDKPQPTDPRDNPSLADLIARVLDSIEKVQKTLGTEPFGEYENLKARLDRLYDEITQVQSNLEDAQSSLQDLIDSTKSMLQSEIDKKFDRAGGSIEGNVNFESNKLENVVLRNTSLAYEDKGNVGGSISIDVNAASVVKMRLIDHVSISFTGNLENSTSMTLIMDRNGSHDVDWSDQIKWAGGNDPAVSQNANEIDVFEFVVMFDGSDRVVYGFPSGLQMG